MIVEIQFNFKYYTITIAFYKKNPLTLQPSFRDTYEINW